jgi:hypothetical protein
MIFQLSRQVFEKVSKIKFHENLSSESRVVPCGQTNVKKLKVAFHNFTNATKNYEESLSSELIG